MSIELKQAAQQALDAIEDLRGYRPDIDSAIETLRAALSQQPSSKEHLFELWWEAHMPNATQEQAWTAFTAAVASNGVGIAARQPATPEPVHATVRNLLLELLNEPDRTLQQRPDRFRRVREAYGLLYDRPAPSVPAGYVPVPLQVLMDASEALGHFVSDYGWGDSDMQAMDNLDAYIARHNQ